MSLRGPALFGHSTPIVRGGGGSPIMHNKCDVDMPMSGDCAPQSAEMLVDRRAFYGDERTTLGAVSRFAAVTVPSASALLGLPREIRNHIYDYVLTTPGHRRDARAVRIERRHLRYFKPSPAAILLLLHHESLLLNRQICAESLEVLFKNHNVYLSCGPFVLKSILLKIEQQTDHDLGKTWLKWIKSVELDWSTFPNLRFYPPNRENGKDEWWWENDEEEVDVDYIPGAQYSGHYDEYDHEGSGYDDNLYGSDDPALYPSFPIQTAALANNNFAQPPDPVDPFGFVTHYPFTDPLQASSEAQEDESLEQDDIATRLELLVGMEVTPLFEYLSSPTFTLRSITVPLYFISQRTYHQRNTSRPGYALPLKLRYWVSVAVHALLMLSSSQSMVSSSKLNEVWISYRPSDVWASMEFAENLKSIAKKGFNFEEGEASLREGEGEVFREVWQGLMDRGLDINKSKLSANVRLVKWDGDLDGGKIGDELEIVFTRPHM